MAIFQLLIGQLGTRGHLAANRVGSVFDTDLDIAGKPISGNQPVRVIAQWWRSAHKVAQVRLSHQENMPMQ